MSSSKYPCKEKGCEKWGRKNGYCAKHLTEDLNFDSKQRVVNLWRWMDADRQLKYPFRRIAENEMNDQERMAYKLARAEKDQIDKESDLLKRKAQYLENKETDSNYLPRMYEQRKQRKENMDEEERVADMERQRIYMNERNRKMMEDEPEKYKEQTKRNNDSRKKPERLISYVECPECSFMVEKKYENTVKLHCQCGLYFHARNTSIAAHDMIEWEKMSKRIGEQERRLANPEKQKELNKRAYEKKKNTPKEMERQRLKSKRQRDERKKDPEKDREYKDKLNENKRAKRAEDAQKDGRKLRANLGPLEHGETSYERLVNDPVRKEAANERQRERSIENKKNYKPCIVCEALHGSKTQKICICCRKNKSPAEKQVEKYLMEHNIMASYRNSAGPCTNKEGTSRRVDFWFNLDESYDLILEIDENQHNMYTQKAEIERVFDLSMQSPKKLFIIRYAVPRTEKLSDENLGELLNILLRAFQMKADSGNWDRRFMVVYFQYDEKRLLRGLEAIEECQPVRGIKTLVQEHKKIQGILSTKI